MDPVFTIYKDDKAKTLIAGNDDARGQDSYLRWQTPEDGSYYIRITDHLNQGGDTYVYRVEMTPASRGKLCRSRKAIATARSSKRRAPTSAVPSSCSRRTLFRASR